MGNTLSCCVSPESSPKLPSRQPAERLEEFQTSTEVSDDNTVPYLQHISDREVPDGRRPLTSSQTWLWAPPYLQLNCCVFKESLCKSNTFLSVNKQTSQWGFFKFPESYPFWASFFFQPCGFTRDSLSKRACRPQARFTLEKSFVSSFCWNWCFCWTFHTLGTGQNEAFSKNETDASLLGLDVTDPEVSVSIVTSQRVGSPSCVC